MKNKNENIGSTNKAVVAKSGFFKASKYYLQR